MTPTLSALPLRAALAALLLLAPACSKAKSEAPPVENSAAAPAVSGSGAGSRIAVPGATPTETATVKTFRPPQGLETATPPAGTPEGAGTPAPTGPPGAAATPGGKAAAPAGATGSAGSPGTAAASTSSDPSYKLSVDAPKTAAAGKESTVRVSVRPAQGWKVNQDFPTKLTVEALEGVAVAKAEQTASDAEKLDLHELTFAVKFTPAAAGQKKFAASLKFAVCTDSTCDPKKEQLAWVVDVN